MFSHIWDFLNKPAIFPWIFYLATALIAIGYYQATVSAQGKEIETNKHLAEKSSDELRADVIDRLESIQTQMGQNFGRVERMDEKIDEIQQDVATICKGKCRK